MLFVWLYISVVFPNTCISKHVSPCLCLRPYTFEGGAWRRLTAIESERNLSSLSIAGCLKNRNNNRNSNNTTYPNTSQAKQKEYVYLPLTRHNKHNNINKISKLTRTTQIYLSILPTLFCSKRKHSIYHV